VQQAADGATAASAQITVRGGQYTFSGQRLPVTQGELRCAGGPPDDPVLRITA
jgi:autotransporter translocation and assembly factor TamB